jgi:hypothetical protein
LYSLIYSFLFKTAIGLKVTIANELRDQVEVFQTSEYPKFLSTLLSLFLDILQNEPPVFISNAPEQVNNNNKKSIYSTMNLFYLFNNEFILEIKKYHS